MTKNHEEDDHASIDRLDELLDSQPEVASLAVQRMNHNFEKRNNKKDIYDVIPLFKDVTDPKDKL